MVTVKSGVPPKLPPERPGAPGGRREQNRLRRVAELCEAGLELFLAEGIAGVTVERIAAGAGTSKGNFYRYFEDKEQLVATLFAPLAAGVAEALDDCVGGVREATGPEELTDAYEAVGISLGMLLFANRSIVLLYLQESRAPGVGARKPVRELADLVGKRAIDLTIAARENGLLRPFDPRISALAVVGAVERLLFGVLSGEHPIDPTEGADALIRIVMDGMRP